MSNLFSSGGAGNVGFSGEVQQSLKFNNDESQYLSWTPTAAGNRTTWTWSGWVKLGEIGTGYREIFGAGNGAAQSEIVFETAGTILLASANAAQTALRTTQVFRDPSAWYHIVWAEDTTQATASNRSKLYVNGVQVTAFSLTQYPSQNFQGSINNNITHYISSYDGASWLFDGYLSNIHFIDGQALGPTSFGQFTNGYWEKKDYAGAYGTNGFHLTFQDDVVSEGFNTVTYTGTSAAQSISGLGFEPDFVWIKGRDSAAVQHMLFDSVRGVNKHLISNSTAVEGTGGLTSFDSDGMTLPFFADVNSNTYGKYVAWCWDAGSGSPVSNTDGSITSTVKANPDYGFSITSFVGNGTLNATVGHSLGAVPEMVLVKNRSTTVGWLAWHKDLSGATYRMDLNGSGAEYNDGNGALQGVSSSLITLGSLNAVNQNSANMICYAFHSVANYSSIGSYTGTGAAGNAVTTGFRPAFVLVKNTTTATDWIIKDSTRDTANPIDANLRPNWPDAEFNNSNHYFDFTDTGFVVNGTDNSVNKSGDTIIYMAFADTREAAFWKDVSGQGNHWTPNNLDYRDSLVDSPANNFCVYNPLDANTSTLSEGNLKVATAETTSVPNTRGTFAVNSGKWYWEIITVDSSSSLRIQSWVGLASTERATNSVVKILVATGNGIIYGNNGSLQSGLTAWSQYDVIGVALDCDNTSVQFYRNGSAYGSAVDYSSFIPSTEFLTPFIIDGASSVVCTTVSNFGQDSTFAGEKPMGAYTDDNSIGNFQYAPPAGYLALCSANLPTPTIIDGSENFNTVLWTGDGSQTRSLTGVNFQPDFSWLKIRSGTTQDHQLYDSVRGAGSGKNLSSNTTAVEGTVNTVSDGDYGFVSSFDADGFSVDDGAIATTGGYVNYSGRTYAAWNWKAGGTAVSNTDGSITSQVSANVDAGFSIVSYTGTGANATVGHGLSAAPEMMIIKDRDSGSNQWLVGHKGITLGTGRMWLNLTSANSSLYGTTFWNDTAPTSTTISLGDNQNCNQSGNNFICYAFHSSDVCKVGTYTGNGSTDGPFVYTGFRPSWVMAKDASVSGQEWTIYDAERDPSNVVRKFLSPTFSQAETTAPPTYDFLSNGFKLRSSDARENRSGSTFIYLAFAEHPFKYANAR